jgi:hypothetical protein
VSITVTSVLDEVYRRINEPNGLSGSDATDGVVLREDMLSYFNDARRKINKKVGELKAEFRIQGITGEITYSYPFDFKSNMYRVEYDGLPLTKANLDTLDQYDPKWRHSDNRTPPDNDPKFFVLDEPNRKVIIYPPPPEDGVIWDLTTDDGVAEALASNDLTAEDGIPEEIVLDGQTIDLTDEDGIPEVVIGQENNIKAFYYKHLINVAEKTGGVDTLLEVEFESYLEAIKYFMKGLVYISPQTQNNELATFNFDLYRDETDDILDEKQHLRPPMHFSVKRKPGKHWGRRGGRSNVL